MPLYWRYFLTSYLKVFSLSVLSFISLLVISRLNETASFAALGASLTTLLFFILYQFPYILPIAIPISSLIASLFFMQRLSRENEFLAFRASGFSLSKIIAPLLLASAFLSLTNLFIVSEVATDSHLASKQMMQEIASLNPMAMLKNKQLLKRKDALIQTGSSKSSGYATDVLVAIRQKDGGRLALFFAKEMRLQDSTLLGKEVSFISSRPADGFDHLIIENNRETKTPATEFTGLLRKNSWNLCPDHLRMRLLLAKMKAEKSSKRIYNKCCSEITRRFIIGFSPFTFTLLGATFGMEVGRKRAKKGLLIVTLLAALSFATFFLAKNSDALFLRSLFYYVLPQLLIIILSIWTFKRIERGVE